MGMTLTVYCPNGIPPWPALASRLAEQGIPPQMRMIDGQLAFPDEEPPADWRELRVALPAGMLTLRRVRDGVQVVTWGNADEAQRREWQALADTIATAGGGTIDLQEHE